ncbi:DUF2971 domain-containing protein [Methanococcus maripaludis]|uniref:DUF2971 domain-containing protein n=1 Tax=Methanococcus maripaludis TaxID=39152 RepID=A0A8T3W133_METMI|nr:DUF2971 domain-containing protein [Methanococcus maripaludis]MBG0768305.1 DUF2971 domain-containing protein [Methanococcus maripaludis]
MWKSEFINKLFAKNVEDVRVDEALDIKSKNIPPKLYRYRKCNSEEIDTILNGDIWLSPVSELNDPFECMIKMGIPSYLERRTKLDGDLTPELRKKIEKTIRDNYSELKKAMDIFKKRIYICCFSESKDSKLMWSHYADSHKGFCIEYDFNSEYTEEGLKCSLFPVIYGEEIFDIVPYAFEKNQNRLVHIHIAMFKEISWKYEKEWRLIYTEALQQGRGNKKGPVITAIYLGAKIDENDKQILMNIANEYDISVYQMEIEDYNLNAKLIQKGTN